MKYGIFVLIHFLILIGFCPHEIQAAPVGKFTFIKGRVDITSPKEKARSAKLGDEISVGDIIRTKSKSKAEITFLDGNLLRLAPSTRLEVEEYLAGLSQKKGRFRLFRGKIQNIIKLAVGRSFGLKENNQYEVYTPTAVVGVRGTNFFTYYVNGISGSIFKEGKGYAYSLNLPDQVMSIEAGQSMQVTSPDLPPVIRPATDMEIKIFEDETSPQEENGSDKEIPEPEINSILKKGLDKEDSSVEEQFITEGIDEQMRGMDSFDRGVEIPQEIPEPDHGHEY